MHLLIIPMAGLHTVEEYFVPGGFLSWVNTVVFGSDDPTRPLSARLAFWIDGVAAIVNITALLVLGTTMPFVVAFVAMALFINAWFHIVYTVADGRYSPGAFTSVVVYLPGLTYVLLTMLDDDTMSIAALAAGSGAALAFTAEFFRRLRSRPARATRSGASAIRPTSDDPTSGEVCDSVAVSRWGCFDRLGR